MRLYEHPSSGNCLKCRIVLRQPRGAADVRYEAHPGLRQADERIGGDDP